MLGVIPLDALERAMRRRKKAEEAPIEVPSLEQARSFLRRLIEEEDLRDAFGRALDSSREVYERVTRAKKPAKLLSDENLHAAAGEAYEALKHVTGELAGAGQDVKEFVKSKPRRFGFGGLLALLGIGGGVALAASEGLRSKLLDALFGAEEEFQYSPPPADGVETPSSPLNAV